MAAYFIKIELVNGVNISFRVKNPTRISVSDLCPYTAWGLVCIDKSRKDTHVTVKRRGKMSESCFCAGALNSWHQFYDPGERLGYAMEIYHDYRDKSGGESVKRLLIEKRDQEGVTKICDLRDFANAIDGEWALDGFDTEKGVSYVKLHKLEGGDVVTESGPDGHKFVKE